MDSRKAYTFALILTLALSVVVGFFPQAAYAEAIDRDDWTCVPAELDAEKTEREQEQTRSCSSGSNRWTEKCAEQDNGRYECRIFHNSSGSGNLFRTDDTYAPDERVTWDPERETATINGSEVENEQDGPLESIARAAGGGLDLLGGGLLVLVAHVFSLIAGIFVAILSPILGLVGYVLDYVMVEFVIEMGKYITAPEATGVRAAWTIFRDLANIGIIGGLVATAIGTIVGSGTYNAQKMLARLILSALLVNFSYFVAGAVIDASNFLARAAYKEAICENSNCGIAERFTTILNGGVAGSRVSANPFSIESAELDANNQPTGEEAGAVYSLVYRIMALIFMGMTMVIFLSVISYLIGRFVAIIFLLVTSPIGIAGGAVPILKSYSDEWWKALWNQTMFAPVYFLLVGISLNIFAQLEDTIRSATFGAETLTENLQTTVGTIALFVVGIGFLMTALNVAKKMAESTERFKQIYDGVKKGTGAIGQVVIGGGSERLLEGFNRFMGRDFKENKNKGLVGWTLNRAARGTQILLKGTPLGRGGEILLKTGASTKFGGEKGESYTEARDRRRGRMGELNTIGEREKGLAAAKTGAKELKEARDKYMKMDGSDPVAQKKAYNEYLQKKSDIEKMLADLPPESYEALKKREPGRLVELAPYIPSGVFKQLSHDKEIPKKFRNDMKDARFRDVTDLIKQADKFRKDRGSVPKKYEADGVTLTADYKAYKDIQGKLFNHFKYSGMKAEDVVQMMQHHHDLFTDSALLDGGMTHGAKMAILDSGEIGDAQKERVKQTWQQSLTDNMKGGGIAAGKVGSSSFAGKSPREITDQIANTNRRKEMVTYTNADGDEVTEEFGQFDGAVVKMKAYFAGKQPMEVARQVHEDHLLEPAFAAAASVEAISALPQVFDPPYLEALTDNIVNLVSSGAYDSDPEAKQRLMGAINYMTTNAGSAYSGYLNKAIAKANKVSTDKGGPGVTLKSVQKGFRGDTA